MSETPQLGAPLGIGRWTDVYDLGDGKVLRRYRDAGMGAAAAFEAEVMTHARRNGVPVPEVFDVDGASMVLEKVVGPTMLADLTRHPRALVRHARTLVELHARVHAVPAPGSLEAPFGEGDALLHLDLHPNNVILSPSGPVLIDWQGAVRGPSAADLAHTWLLIRTSTVPGAFVQRLIGSAGVSSPGSSSPMPALTRSGPCCLRSPPAA